MVSEENPAITILVTPVWKDSQRLEEFGAELARVLAARKENIDWVIADDGSGEEEVSRLQELRGKFAKIYPRVQVHAVHQHEGKGSVVRSGWATAPEAGWYAFVDADGSVTAEDMCDLIATAHRQEASVIAVRINTETTTVEEGPLRWILHHGFLLVCRLLLGVHSADTQCGAKVFRGDDYRGIRDHLVEPGLAFDAELLAALTDKDRSWLEKPVNWVRKGGSRIHPIRDSLAMLRALWRVRRSFALD